MNATNLFSIIAAMSGVAGMMMAAMGQAWVRAAVISEKQL
jgi:hypothetical protein